MKFNRFLAIVLCAFSVLTLCSCGSENAESKKRIAVIAKAVDSDFWHNVKNGVESAATEYNVSVTFDGPENEEDYAAQNKMINQAVSDGVDAIVISAIDYTKSTEAVNNAVRHGVKVVTIDSDLESDMISLFIGTDNEEAGKAAGKAATDGFAAEAEIYIGLVNYNANTENGRQREIGFKEYVDSVPNAHIVAEVTADSNTESATAGAVELLRNNPQINVLVGFNEWMTLGVGNAIKQLSLADKVRGIGFDTNVISVGMIETGEMDALIVQNPFAIGYLGIQKASALISGESFDEHEIYTSVTTVNKNNLFDDEIQKMLFRFK